MYEQRRDPPRRRRSMRRQRRKRRKLRESRSPRVEEEEEEDDDEEDVEQNEDQQQAGPGSMPGTGKERNKQIPPCRRRSRESAGDGGIGATILWIHVFCLWNMALQWQGAFGKGAATLPHLPHLPHLL
jgi:hypothetical protein